MNKKGMSLIEMVMTIMILSIAGFMIVSGFMAVLHFISRANDIQYASDTMLSYAEKSDNTVILDEIDAHVRDTTYTITNDSGKSVKVNAHITSLTSKIEDSISLHVIRNEIYPLVKDMPSYIQSKEYAEKLYTITNETMNTIPQGLPYANIYKTIFHDVYHGNWDNFASELLPKAFGDIAPSAKPYKIVGFFPWEHFKGNSFENGQVLLYLSQDYTASLPTTDKEILHVVYDYLEQCWYYFPGDDYEIAYSGYGLEEPVFLYKGNNQSITSYEMLRSFIKARNSGWYILDEKAEFDEKSPDKSWIPIT